MFNSRMLSFCMYYKNFSACSVLNIWHALQRWFEIGCRIKAGLCLILDYVVLGKCLCCFVICTKCFLLEWQSLVANEDFQHILRVLNTNVDGKQKIMFALTSIKGIGRRFANLICKKADVDMNKRLDFHQSCCLLWFSFLYSISFDGFFYVYSFVFYVIYRCLVNLIVYSLFIFYFC